ncbi:hypothetical protein [Chroococcidiopsis sp. TS-821]|uniref:hypothetical protein n=1 Tax=Chroococcidiopsis sp. TS-821 TaxID=1378066 RepID=UPI000CED864B|nr:hypothetical protein [Chroococcidiopsis sp. TS-821]PPS45110.1 hypothetical protein B1A85_02230 [Chroococcidiopsis sp. TS-821]
MDLPHYQLWDFAGVDGLQFAKTLVGDAAGRLAPFQSLEATIADYPCSLLRLCENNFRLGVRGVAIQSPAKMRVWVKQCETIQAIALPNSSTPNLLQIATTKPPHRLQNLALNRAIPARINNISVLIWYHSPLEKPVLELHTAVKNIVIVKATLLPDS